MPFTAPKSRPHLAALLGAAALCGGAARAADLQGSLHVGTAAADMRSDTFTEGLDKSPFGIETPAARLTLRVDFAPFGDFAASVVADADSQRSDVLDVQELWIGWNPVPQSPWRTRVKVGAFFPVTSLEVGYDSIGWNATRTLSSSAINSWIAEEIRIVGAELTQQWRGAMLDSPHTFTARLGVFGGNDPAGTMLAWRGWNLGGRVTGLTQNLRLPDLPVYGPNGAVPAQSRSVHLFRELDHRAGAYASLGYANDEWLEVTALRYDNRGDPLRLENGQYSWRTRFDHLGLRLKIAGEVELLAQGLRGDTLMGPDAVNVEFSSWYLLASRALGPGLATVRHDRFRTTGRDQVPGDVNDEHGNAWSLAYSLPVSRDFTLVAEALRVDSQRAARSLFASRPRQSESSLAFELRWRF